MKSGGGIITHKDLSQYKPIWHQPIEFTYRDSFTVYTMPPSSAGGMILNEMMNMSETINLHSLGFHTTASIHWLAETEKELMPIELSIAEMQIIIMFLYMD